MSVSDLRDFEDNAVIETDICIVGSGPAGLSIAKEFAGTNTQVWVVESGGYTEEPDTQALYEIESVGVPRMPQERVRNRILGGSTHTWFGRCAPFNEMDFQQRDWVPYSGWPIELESLVPYLERASKNLGLGPSYYDQRLERDLNAAASAPKFDSSLLRNQFWQYSKVSNTNREPVRFGPNFFPKLKDVPNIHVLMHANVTHINTNQQGTKVESVDVSTLEHKQARIQARVVILCCGGVENARLLLASNRIVPQGVGNQNDTVGRFLADHPGTVLGTFAPKHFTKINNYFGNYWLFNQAGKHYYNRGIALSPEIQKREGLLNCAAYLNTTTANDDPWEAMKRLRDRIKKVRQVSTPMHRDVLALLAHPGTVAQGLYQHRVVKRPPVSRAKELEVYCLTEQLPNPDSRVMLSEQKDALGMPLSKIDWRISDLEKQSVRRLGQLIQQESQRLKLPPLILEDWLDSDEPWRHRMKDRSHPTSTTRMSINPKEGVVDSNCQVHGVDGLFVAGSSTFPTTGYANPTLMIISMSIRIADWLKATHFHSSSQFSPKASTHELETVA